MEQLHRFGEMRLDYPKTWPARLGFPLTCA